MGLAIVHGIMRSLGGSIVLESSSPLGTTFALWFPRADDAPDAPKERDPTPKPPPPVAERLQLALIDDDASILRVLTRVLVKNNIEVTPFNTAEAFLQSLDEVAWDIAVSDIHMPGMSGTELLREARGRRPELPFVLFSGYYEQSSELQGLARCVFLHKPVALPKLLEAFQQLLPDLELGATKG